MSLAIVHESQAEGQPLAQPSPLWQQVCGNLRRRRRAMGLTLKEVARICQTTPQTIQRLETCNMTISIEWIDRLCVALKMEPAELFDGHPGAHEKMDKMRAEIRAMKVWAESFLRSLDTFLEREEASVELPNLPRRRDE